MKVHTKIISSAISDTKIPIYGDGTQIRDWLFVEDHVEAIVSVLELGRSGDVYNIGGGTELTNISLALMICKPWTLNLLYRPAILSNRLSLLKIA